MGPAFQSGLFLGSEKEEAEKCTVQSVYGTFFDLSKNASLFPV